MFSLPQSTRIQKVISKNTFDPYTTSKQKSGFTDKIRRITWTNKISLDTVNLVGNEVKEIQVFKIELKEKVNIKDLITIIEKAIPYHIIFWIQYGGQMYASTSAKHLNPKDENSAVVDYMFISQWMDISEIGYQVELKNNLDWVFKNFCDQLATRGQTVDTIRELVEYQKKDDAVKREIEKLKSEIAKCKQFNKKVELNMKLKKLLG